MHKGLDPVIPSVPPVASLSTVHIPAFCAPSHHPTVMLAAHFPSQTMYNLQKALTHQGSALSKGPRIEVACNPAVKEGPT